MPCIKFSIAAIIQHIPIRLFLHEVGGMLPFQVKGVAFDSHAIQRR